MKINRETFLNHLEMVKSGLSQREVLEQSSCFAFRDGYVMTFNDEISCRIQTEARITGAINATSLLSILQKIEDAELKIRENDRGELEFRGKNKGFGVTKDAEVFLPIDQVEMPEKWRALPAGFSEAINQVRHCVSSDETKDMLTHIHIHPEYIEACDNRAMMRYKLSTGLKNPVLVRGSAAVQITTLGMSEIATTKNWIHFRNEAGLIFSCRKHADNYYELDPFLKCKGHPIVIPKGLAEACDRAATFSEDKTSEEPLVTVSLSNGVIRVKGQGVSGWYKEIKKVSYEGPSFEFLIAPELLKHISEKYSNAVIAEEKLKATGENWQYVTVFAKPSEEDKEENETEEDSDE